MERITSSSSLSEGARTESSSLTSSYIQLDMESVSAPTDVLNAPTAYEQKTFHSDDKFGFSTQDNFSFVTSAETASLDGSLTTDYNSSHLSKTEKWDGPGAKFLNRQGFGWLMEVEELDDDDNQPLLQELDIDVRDIAYKLRCVILPFNFLGQKRHVLRDSPDFWGPLFAILTFALVSLYGQFRVVSWIITIWFMGSMCVFLLARALGGEVNYSQCLGVIGYCILPLIITGTMLPVVREFTYLTTALKLAGVLWASYSAGSLLCVEELQQKRLLLLYPIFLLYIYFLSLHTGA